MKESDIQRAILDFLEAKQVTHWRCSLGGTFVRNRGAIAFRKNPMTGFPDVAGICPDSGGKFFTVEVKTPKGRLSPEQKVWKDKLEGQGVLYIIATSVEDVRLGLTR